MGKSLLDYVNSLRKLGEATGEFSSPSWPSEDQVCQVPAALTESLRAVQGKPDLSVSRGQSS